MAKKSMAKDVLVKLIVGAGQASPSPPVGPALGSKGVKSMDFCKEFNARTAHYNPGTPIPALVTVRPDRSFTFELRSPPTATLLLAAAGAPSVKARVRGAGNTAGPLALGRAVASQTGSFAGPGADGDGRSAFAVGAAGKAAGKELAGNAKLGSVGTVSLKHVFEIAKIKATETRLEGLGLEKIARGVVAQAGSMGVVVVP